MERGTCARGRGASRRRVGAVGGGGGKTAGRGAVDAIDPRGCLCGSSCIRKAQAEALGCNLHFPMFFMNLLLDRFCVFFLELCESVC